MDRGIVIHIRRNCRNYGRNPLRPCVIPGLASAGHQNSGGFGPFFISHFLYQGLSGEGEKNQRASGMRHVAIRSTDRSRGFPWVSHPSGLRKCACFHYLICCVAYRWCRSWSISCTTECNVNSTKENKSMATPRTTVHFVSRMPQRLNEIGSMFGVVK